MKNSSDMNLLSCLLQLFIIEISPICNDDDYGDGDDDGNDDERFDLEIH